MASNWFQRGGGELVKSFSVELLTAITQALPGGGLTLYQNLTTTITLETHNVRLE